MRDVEITAKALLIKHGLHNWNFEWDSARKRFGKCSHRSRTISLSKVLTPLRSHEDVLNTILHEIAHALVGAGNGHNHVWRTKFIQIGGNGQRCGNDIEDTKRLEIKGGWIGTCPNGHIHRRYRKPTRESSCGKCSSKFDERYILTYVKQ